jgi:glutathione peroxidase
MGAAESVPETSLHEFTVKVPRIALAESPHDFFFFFIFFSNSFGGNFREQDCNGKEVCLETYKGKVLLVVNVASKWSVPVSPSPWLAVSHQFSASCWRVGY